MFVLSPSLRLLRRRVQRHDRVAGRSFAVRTPAMFTFRLIRRVEDRVLIHFLASACSPWMLAAIAEARNPSNNRIRDERGDVPLADAFEPRVERFDCVDLRVVTLRDELVAVEELNFAVVPSRADGFLPFAEHDFHVRQIMPLLFHC